MKNFNLNKIEYYLTELFLCIGQIILNNNYDKWFVIFLYFVESILKNYKLREIVTKEEGTLTKLKFFEDWISKHLSCSEKYQHSNYFFPYEWLVSEDFKQLRFPNAGVFSYKSLPDFYNESDILHMKYVIWNGWPRNLSNTRVLSSIENLAVKNPPFKSLESSSSLEQLIV